MRTLLALLPLAFGLPVHLLTLWVAAVFLRECLRGGRFTRRSGVPLVGPALIDLGLWLLPSTLPWWLYLLPWALEAAVILASIAVQRATHARPMD